MTAFPDMVVKMDRVSQEGSHAVFHWTWTGINRAALEAPAGPSVFAATKNGRLMLTT